MLGTYKLYSQISIAKQLTFQESENFGKSISYTINLVKAKKVEILDNCRIEKARSDTIK